jgi:hypothetical protein
MQLKALSAENFDLFESIFTPGGSGCYCAVWRTYDETWEQRCKDRSLPNLSYAKSAVIGGAHWGFLAFDENGFAGWTASGPKTEFPLLQTKLASRTTPFSPEIWSIGCIAFKETGNNESKAAKIIKAVADTAREANAEFLEAYPTDPWDKPRSYRGSLVQFMNLGFEEFSSEQDGESRILCMRLKL